MMISIIIPACREPLLNKTIDSLIDRVEGDIEIIPILDGWEPDDPLPQIEEVKPIRFTINQGMRAAINAGLEMARGQYVMKTDAHCVYAKGFDVVMANDCGDNQVMIPTRYSLREDLWDKDESKYANKSCYLSFPHQENLYGYHLNPIHSHEWDQRIGTEGIVDTMSFQGSCWFVNKKYFSECVGKLREDIYGTFACENHEIGLSYWLSDGEVKVNCKTWYAHLSKQRRHYNTGKYERMSKHHAIMRGNYTDASVYWMNNKHDKPKRFSWLIDKFWAIPGWPDDWQEKWNVLCNKSGVPK